MDPITQIILGVLALAGITIPAILNYMQNRATAADVKAARAEQLEIAEERKAEAAEVEKKVATLATNIDGAMTEIKETIAAKNLAEGKLEGIAGEQARVAEAPQPVTPSASEQLDKIEASVEHTKEVLAETPAVRPAVRKQLDKIEEAVCDDDGKCDEETKETEVKEGR